MKTDSLALNSDMYAKTISGYFTMALSKLKKKNKADADFMGLLLFLQGTLKLFRTNTRSFIMRIMMRSDF